MEKKEANDGIDLVAFYQQSQEHRATTEELATIMRHSQEKHGNVGPIPSYATTFLWQVSVQIYVFNIKTSFKFCNYI